MPPKRDAPQFQLPLDVAEADLPDPFRRVLPVVTRKRGEHQHFRRLHLPGDVARGGRGLLPTLRRGGRRGRVVPVGRIQVYLGASGHQLPFPLHGPARGHLAHHANGHVQHEPRVRVVRFAKSDHLGVQLRPHLSRQQVGPTDVRGLAQIHETVRNEFFSRLGTREETLDGAAAVERVATFRQRRDVLKSDGILLRRGQHLLAQAPGTGVQTGPPVALPVRPSALPRTIEAGAVMTAFVRLLSLGQCCRIAALVIPATNHLLSCVAGHQSVRVLIVVERHSSMCQQWPASSRLRTRCFQRRAVAALAFPPHNLAHVIRGTLLRSSLHVHHALSGLCDISPIVWISSEN